jgi:hypothetical protein
VDHSLDQQQRDSLCAYHPRSGADVAGLVGGAGSTSPDVAMGAGGEALGTYADSSDFLAAFQITPGGSTINQQSSTGYYVAENSPPVIAASSAGHATIIYFGGKSGDDPGLLAFGRSPGGSFGPAVSNRKDWLSSQRIGAPPASRRLNHLALTVSLARFGPSRKPVVRDRPLLRLNLGGGCGQPSAEGGHQLISAGCPHRVDEELQDEAVVDGDQPRRDGLGFCVVRTAEAFRH